MSSYVHFTNLQNEIMMNITFKIRPTSVTGENLFSSSREDSNASRTGYDKFSQDSKKIQCVWAACLAQVGLG